MSSLPLREKQLGLKESKRLAGNDNTGFKGSTSNPDAPYKKSDWQGTVKGTTKHTYKRG